MKAGIHPEYKAVVFQDISSDFAFLTRSTIKSKETIKWEDGKEYPLVKVEVSSASHPFYTGKHKMLDSGGRVERARRRGLARPSDRLLGRARAGDPAARTTRPGQEDGRGDALHWRG